MVKFITMIVLLTLFLITYLTLLIFPKYKPWIALGMAGLFVLFDFVSVQDVVSDRMNWNVFMIIGGTMLVIQPFIDSGMPAKLADMLMEKVHHAKGAILALSLFAGIVSAFVDNVATVLIVAPIAIDVAKKLNRSPIPLVIAVSVFANIQGFATLVGDTTSVMLAGALDMSFFDFFWIESRPGPFFIVQLGTIFSLGMLWYLLGKKKEPLELHYKTNVKDMAPTYFLLAILGLLIAASFFDNLHALTNGFITLGVGVSCLVYRIIQRRSLHGLLGDLKAVDTDTLLLLLGLFTLIIGLENGGVIDEMGRLFESVSGDNVLILYTLIVFVSVLASAFVDNIPYVATLLPVMMTLSNTLNIDPFLLLFGLLAGATLGGNITPIGASANIAGIGLLKKQGYHVRVSDFLKIGLPITLAAVLSSYIFIWLLFGM